MKYHDQFECDPKKAKSNIKKHQGATFDDAAGVLGDDWADIYDDEVYDDANSVDEDRIITTGSHPDDRRVILKISWTSRSTDEGPITRIISARLVTPHESNRYVKKIRGR